MEKRTCLIMLMLICGCDSRRSIACSRIINDRDISIVLEAEYDRLSAVKVKEAYELPLQLFYHQGYLADFTAKIADPYYLAGNKLYAEYLIPVEEGYSLRKTVEMLKKEKYYCD